MKALLAEMVNLGDAHCRRQSQQVRLMNMTKGRAQVKGDMTDDYRTAGR